MPVSKVRKLPSSNHIENRLTSTGATSSVVDRDLEVSSRVSLISDSTSYRTMLHRIFIKTVF